MSDRIVDLYERHAAAWDRQRGRELIEAGWIDRFAAVLPRAGTVLDLGCGMGEPIARHLVERGFAVTGVDSSPSLLALARKRLPDQHWIEADMRGLTLGCRFDGILAWHSLFHLTADDQRAMFPRFAAHAARGGALMFTSGPEAGEAIGEWQCEPLRHASLDADEYRSLLSENGFVVLDHQARDRACGEATVWLARKT